jgi:hypothetical protein
VALREWASDLNHIWLELGRKMTKDVAVRFYFNRFFRNFTFHFLRIG